MAPVDLKLKIIVSFICAFNSAPGGGVVHARHAAHGRSSARTKATEPHSEILTVICHVLQVLEVRDTRSLTGRAVELQLQKHSESVLRMSFDSGAGGACAGHAVHDRQLRRHPVAPGGVGGQAGGGASGGAVPLGALGAAVNEERR